jgi:hypothetical protein
MPSQDKQKETSDEVRERHSRPQEHPPVQA